jgi:hypothetical protein
MKVTARFVDSLTSDLPLGGFFPLFISTTTGSAM